MDVYGQVDARFGPVRECFAELVRGQAGTGAAFAAWCDGRPVADLWGGWADQGRTRPWEQGSLVQPYSVSKPFAAVCVLRLAEAGRLDLDAPVQRYWPEFRAPATVRDVLSHQAGVVTLGEPAPTEAFYDWDRLCALLAAQEPAWEPGTAHGESALFYGHLTGELVRRVDGRRPGQFLREEICGPAGLDFAFGLSPSEQTRVVNLTGLDAAFRASAAAGRPAMYQRAVANPPGALDAEVVNGAAWRAAEIPAVNGHGTARAVAGFYHALATHALLSPGLLAEAVSPQCSGPDRVSGGKNAWGLGFGVSDDGYGMGGLGGSYGGTCPDGGYAVGFVTGSVGSFDRADALENALRSCLGRRAKRAGRCGTDLTVVTCIVVLLLESSPDGRGDTLPPGLGNHDGIGWDATGLRTRTGWPPRTGSRPGLGAVAQVVVVRVQAQAAGPGEQRVGPGWSQECSPSEWCSVRGSLPHSREHFFSAVYSAP